MKYPVAKITANNTVTNVKWLAKDMLDILTGISKFKQMSFTDFNDYINAGWDNPEKYIPDYGKHYAIDTHHDTNKHIYRDILLVAGARRKLYKSSISPEMRNLPGALLANIINGLPASAKFTKIKYILDNSKKTSHLLLTDIANNRAFGGNDWQEWMDNPISWILKNKPKEIRELFNPLVETNTKFSPLEMVNLSIIDAFHSLAEASDEDHFIAFSWALRVLQEERNTFNERIVFPANPFGPLSVPHIELLPTIADHWSPRIQLLSNGSKTSLKRFAKNVIAEQLGLGDGEQHRNFRRTLEFRIFEQYPNEVREIARRQAQDRYELFAKSEKATVPSQFPRPYWFTPEIEKEFHNRVTWLSTTSDLSHEADIMLHCVSTYANACREGHSVIFSITTPAGRSTMEIRNDSNDLYINQNNARKNEKPSEENIKLGEEFLKRVKENER